MASLSEFSKMEEDWNATGKRRRRRAFKLLVNVNGMRKTGLLNTFILLGLIGLIYLPWGNCRPLEGESEGEGELANLNYSYERIKIPREISSDEAALGESFQFQRKSPGEDAPRRREFQNFPRNPDLVQRDQNESNENPLLNNGSMIVKVIVTSSSSTSSSSSEDEDEVETENGGIDPDITILQEKVKEELQRVNKDNTPPLPLKSAQFNLEQSARPVSPTQMEFRRVPKPPMQNESGYPPDIFSAFYRAFAQNPSETEQTSTLSSNGKDNDFFSLSSFSGSTTDKPFSTFSVKPQFRSRPQHNLYLYQQRRRRLFRNKQQEERKTFSSQSQSEPENERMLVMVTAPAPLPTEGMKGDPLQEAAQRLEQLARKLDNSKLERISPSSSSVKETTVSPSTQFHLSPSKIAVSVAVTHSQSVAVSPPIAPAARRQEENVLVNKSTDFPDTSSSFTFQRRSFKPRPKIMTDSRPPTHNKSDADFVLQDRSNLIPYSEDSPQNAPFRNFPEARNPDTESDPAPRKITRTVSAQIGDPSQQINSRYIKDQKTVPMTTTPPKITNWQEPAKIWSQPAQVWGTPSKVWSEPARVWSEPAKVWNQPDQQATKTNTSPSKPRKRKLGIYDDEDDEMMQSDQPQPPEENNEESPPGTFVILGDDENEGDSIDGDLGKPLMLHHFTIPPSPPDSMRPENGKSVSISTSVSSSVSSSNKNIFSLSKKPPTPTDSDNTDLGEDPQQESLLGSSSNDSSSYDRVGNNSSDPTATTSQKKSPGNKFGYVIEGANVRKYRVEERTSDGFIVGEYGVLSNQNAFLRGVRYTADGTINPRLIHEALMKFLSLR